MTASEKLPPATRDALITELLGRLADGLLQFGKEMAEASTHGALFQLEQGSQGGKRVAVVVATNDAADHLVDFCNEQARMRKEACDKAGIGLTLIHPRDKGAT